MSVELADIRLAEQAVVAVARRTPLLPAPELGERVGGTVALKAENLQLTGSFKLRGSLAKLAALPDDAAGVVTGSAGNHAQGLAYAARVRGIVCEVYMPADAPIAKEEAAAALGAIVHRTGGSVHDCIAAARERVVKDGLVFVHPFDDADVIAGQGTLGLELLDDAPDLARVVVPVGGGGLASGIAIATKSQRPAVEVIGVRVEARPTIADGIAIKGLGELTGPLVDEWLDALVVVGEDEIAEAMALLLEQAKLVVEGAGAVGVAALLGGQASPAPRGTTVAVLSGGNVDADLLAAVTRLHETKAGRRLVVLTRLSDRPGELARLLACVAKTGANVVNVEHVREGLELHVRETAIELVLETRGRPHAEDVLRSLADSGYAASVLR